jgi:hypothetical protein
VLNLATERAGSQIDNFPEPFLDRLETMLRNVQHMSGKRELFVCQADLDVINAGLPDYKDLSQIKMRVDARLGRGDVKMRVGGGEISDLFENLAQPDVHEPEAVVTAKLDGDSVDHGMVAQAETDKDAQVAESPTPNPEASDIKKETPDTADEVKDVAAPDVAPDVEVATDVPEAAADQLAQDTTSEKVVADTAPEAVAPNSAPDQIEQVAQEGEPVSVAATDKVALKDD